MMITDQSLRVVVVVLREHVRDQLKKIYKGVSELEVAEAGPEREAQKRVRKRYCWLTLLYGVSHWYHRVLHIG